MTQSTIFNHNLPLFCTNSEKIPKNSIYQSKKWPGNSNLKEKPVGESGATCDD